MKHIFTIHSSLTFLVAYSVIKYLKIDKDDVLIISSSYTVPTDTYKVVKSFAEKYNSVFNKILNWNIPLSHDKYVEEAIGDEKFIAYIDLMSVYQRILITHKNCEEFHFIEEGNSAYMAEDDIDDLTWEGVFRGITFRQKYFSKSFYQSLLRVLRGYNYRLLQLPYHYMAYVNIKNIKFYCFSNNAFYNAPNSKKIKIQPHVDDPLITYLANNLSLDNDIIWIDGSNSRYTGLPESYYHDAIKRAVLKLKNDLKYKNKKRIYLKLRPGLTNIGDNFLYSELIKNGFEVNVLPRKINLECLFLCSNNCVVIGVLTAALEYAHAFGHKSVSIYNLFEHRPETFFDRMPGFISHLHNL